MKKFATWLAYFVVTILSAICVFLIITVVSDESVSVAQRVVAFMHGFIDCCLLGVIVAKKSGARSVRASSGYTA